MGVGTWEEVGNMAEGEISSQELPEWILFELAPYILLGSNT
jgi:hypothetical protein